MEAMTRMTNRVELQAIEVMAVGRPHADRDSDRGWQTGKTGFHAVDQQGERQRHPCVDEAHGAVLRFGERDGVERHQKPVEKTAYDAAEAVDGRIFASDFSEGKAVGVLALLFRIATARRLAVGCVCGRDA